MNDMNEVLLEIRRRGAERIRARKRIRNRIVACCVPVALCAAVLLAIPMGTPLDITEGTAVDQMTDQLETQTSPERSDVTLWISGKGIDVCSSDPDRVERLREWLGGLSAGFSYPSAYSADSAITREEREDRKETDVISIRIEENGESFEYLLSGSALHDTEHEKFYPISKTQYRELLRLLEIDPA